MFQNCKIGTLIREKYNHYYNNIESKWTPIEPINKNIKVGKMQSFIITWIQFSIQLTTVRTIQHSQGLSLNELVFDPTIIFKKWVNMYIYIYIYIWNKRNKIFLLIILQHENIYVNPKVDIEMNKLNTSATWIPFILQSKNSKLSGYT
jgi:hypothetical protein